MMEKVTAGTLGSIENPVLRSYVARYVNIEQRFRERVVAEGLDFAPDAGTHPTTDGSSFPDSILFGSARVENDGLSLVAGWRSSACVNCHTGKFSETFLFDNRCPRSCFFCFNKNQADYVESLDRKRDIVSEIEQRHASGVRYTHIALSGGEPLLYPDDAVTFIARCRALYPDTHLRLYTSDACLNAEVIDALAEAGLDEIRLSIKTDEGADSIAKSLEAVSLAVGCIPAVMVEMPVMPGELDLMKDLLCELDSRGAKGINLLELGFPFYNADEFARRGLRLSAVPYRVLDDYAYAGGLPVAGSEETAIALVSFACERGLHLGVHYCSVGNRLTGETYARNAPYVDEFPLCELSPRDFFLKSAKVFGTDAGPVREVLRREGVTPLRYDRQFDYLEFPLRAVGFLSADFPDLVVGVSYYNVVLYEGERVLRELRVDLTTPGTFDYALDI